MPLTVQFVVPLAVPLPPALFAHVTCVTPTLSDEVPPMVKELVLVVNVGLEADVSIVIEGGVASPPPPPLISRFLSSTTSPASQFAVATSTSPSASTSPVAM